MRSIQWGALSVRPSKIICIGRNYVAHAEELGNAVPKEPVIFIKPNSAIGDVLLSTKGETLHYEAELCFLVKNKQFTALGIGLDLTKRALQKTLKDHQLPWERAKSFDGSAVFSEFIDLNEDLNIEDLGIRLSINHIVKQSGNVTQMLFKPKELLRFIQTDISFEDGDILMTGTPEGVGAIASGDFFQAEVLHRGTVILNCQWTAR